MFRPESKQFRLVSELHASTQNNSVGTEIQLVLKQQEFKFNSWYHGTFPINPMLLEASVLCMMQKTWDFNGHVLGQWLHDIQFSQHYTKCQLKSSFSAKELRPFLVLSLDATYLTSVLLLSEVEQESLKIKLSTKPKCVPISVSVIWTGVLLLLFWEILTAEIFHGQIQRFLLQFNARKMVPVKLIPKEGRSQITIFLILRGTTRFEWVFFIWQSRQESLQERGRITRNEHNPEFVWLTAPNISKLNLQISCLKILSSNPLS